MFAFHDKMTREERKIWSLRQYEKYIRLMHGGAEVLGIKSLFLIQPIPGWGKPLTERERIVARGAHRKLYKEMTDHVVGLREQFGVPVYSLLDVFQGTKEEIYKDQAHVNELGNEIMARTSRRFDCGGLGLATQAGAITCHRSVCLILYSSSGRILFEFLCGVPLNGM